LKGISLVAVSKSISAEGTGARLHVGVGEQVKLNPVVTAVGSGSDLEDSEFPSVARALYNEAYTRRP